MNGDPTGQAPAAGVRDADARKANWRTIRKTQEALIFGLGVLCAVAIAVWFVILGYGDPRRAGVIPATLVAHLTGGRAAGIAFGLSAGLSRTQMIVLGSLTETTVVCLFFSLFSLSFKKLITARSTFLTETMLQLHASASRRRRQLLKWGIPGLILFVWFPFFMTGPVVGSVLGFVLGMRPWVTVSTVLGGTVLALISWTFLIDPLVTWVNSVGEFVPLMVVLFLLILAVSYRVGRTLEQARRPPRRPEAEGE